MRAKTHSAQYSQLSKASGVKVARVVVTVAKLVVARVRGTRVHASTALEPDQQSPRAQRLCKPFQSAETDLHPVTKGKQVREVLIKVRETR